MIEPSRLAAGNKNNPLITKDVRCDRNKVSTWIKPHVTQHIYPIHLSSSLEKSNGKEENIQVTQFRSNKRPLTRKRFSNRLQIRGSVGLWCVCTERQICKTKVMCCVILNEAHAFWWLEFIGPECFPGSQNACLRSCRKTSTLLHDLHNVTHGYDKFSPWKEKDEGLCRKYQTRWVRVQMHLWGSELESRTSNRVCSLGSSRMQSDC